MACGIENPSNTGTACVTPSPESRTIPVVLPDEYLWVTHQPGSFPFVAELTAIERLEQK